MRVIVVDNDVANGLIAQSILVRNNHDVEIITRGDLALTKSLTHPPDAFLLDIMMPGIDGLQISKYLQNGTPTRLSPIRIALTAYNDAEHIPTYQAAGIQGLIAKPLRPGDFDRAIGQIKAGGFPMINCFARDHVPLKLRPLLDDRVIWQGPGLADDVTRERIWRYYRSGLSESLRRMSYALPGTLKGDVAATEQMRKAIHDLRSASLMVGLERAPLQAEELRNAPPSQIVVRMTELLQTIRESLPLLHDALLDVNRHSVATR